MANDFFINSTPENLAETKQEIISDSSLPPSDLPNAGANPLWKGLAVGIIIALLIAVIAWSYIIVRKNLTDAASLRFARAIHLPAGFVNRTSIAYAEFADNTRAIKIFYELNKKKNAEFVAPAATELRKSVWDRLVRTAILKELATKYKLVVSPKDANEEFKKLSAALGSEDAADKMIRESYGWSTAEFKQQVLMPFLLQQKIFTATSTAEIVNAKARSRAEEVLAKIKEGKEQFSDLAKQYSEDGSAAQGGDLGWFDNETMVKPFSDAAFALKLGETSDIVQTEFGFHIIKLLKREEKKGKPARIHAAHILLRADINKFLDDLEKQSIIKQWVKIE